MKCTLLELHLALDFFLHPPFRSQASNECFSIVSHSQPPCQCKSVATRPTQTALSCSILIQSEMPSRQSNLHNRIRHLPWICLLYLHKRSTASQLTGKGVVWPTVPSPTCQSSKRTSVCGAMDIPSSAPLLITASAYVKHTGTCYQVSLLALGLHTNIN